MTKNTKKLSPRQNPLSHKAVNEGVTFLILTLHTPDREFCCSSRSGHKYWRLRVYVSFVQLILQLFLSWHSSSCLVFPFLFNISNCFLMFFHTHIFWLPDCSSLSANFSLCKSAKCMSISCGALWCILWLRWSETLTKNDIQIWWNQSDSGQSWGLMVLKPYWSIKLTTC